MPLLTVKEAQAPAALPDAGQGGAGVAGKVDGYLRRREAGQHRPPRVATPRFGREKRA